MKDVHINREAVQRIIDSPVQTAPRPEYPYQPYTTYESDIWAGGTKEGMERLRRYRQDPAKFRAENS